MYFLEKLNYINSFLQKAFMITDFVLSLTFLPLESELWMRKNITWIWRRKKRVKLFNIIIGLDCSKFNLV